jgi:hypothetical protein
MYRDPLEAAAEHVATLSAELTRVERALGESEGLALERDRLRAELARTEAWTGETRRKRHLAMIERVARVEIASPCDQAWAEMTGDDRKRRCSRCDRDVYDLTAHSLEEVDALLRPADDMPCIQFFRRSDGTVLTSDCPSANEHSWARRALEIGAISAAALVAAGAAAVVLTPPLGGRGRVTQSRSDALEVRSAVLLYMGQEAGADCPTMEELVHAGVLDHSRRTADAWDEDFVVECDGDDIEVISSGPDRTVGTEDDIRP